MADPMATGPTKWRADHCVTHHHACDCREWEHACTVMQLEAELEALRKRCEAVEADAARYRWLIANQLEYRDGDDGLAWMTMQWNLGPASLAPGCIDAAISQAIAAAQEPSHG